MTADDVTHSPPLEPSASCVVRDEDGDLWQWSDGGSQAGCPHAGWVELVPDLRLHPLPWDQLAPHVRAVLVPLPGLVPSDREPRR